MANLCLLLTRQAGISLILEAAAESARFPPKSNGACAWRPFFVTHPLTDALAESVRLGRAPAYESARFVPQGSRASDVIETGVPAVGNLRENVNYGAPLVVLSPIASISPLTIGKQRLMWIASYAVPNRPIFRHRVCSRRRRGYRLSFCCVCGRNG
jgi:hypothetical protein